MGLSTRTDWIWVVTSLVVALLVAVSLDSVPSEAAIYPGTVVPDGSVMSSPEASGASRVSVFWPAFLAITFGLLAMRQLPRMSAHAGSPTHRKVVACVCLALAVPGVLGVGMLVLGLL